MIDKIKDWVFINYGIRIETRHVWMVFILLVSILLLIISLIANWEPSGEKIDPKNMPPLPL